MAIIPEMIQQNIVVSELWSKNKYISIEKKAKNIADATE